MTLAVETTRETRTLDSADTRRTVLTFTKRDVTRASLVSKQQVFLRAKTATSDPRHLNRASSTLSSGTKPPFQGSLPLIKLYGQRENTRRFGTVLSIQSKMAQTALEFFTRILTFRRMAV